MSINSRAIDKNLKQIIRLSQPLISPKINSSIWSEIHRQIAFPKAFILFFALFRHYYSRYPSSIFAFSCFLLLLFQLVLSFFLQVNTINTEYQSLCSPFLISLSCPRVFICSPFFFIYFSSYHCSQGLAM